MEEMNLDTNNVNIGIMADEITKYNKGFKNKENALDFNPEFFGIKEKEKFVLNSKFFNDEVNHNNNNEGDEISPEKLKKMRKFYQVGFKGLSSKENTKKEMQLSKDKKKIIINKKKELEEISEKEEEGPFEMEPYEKDFFTKEKEDDKEEIVTQITKKQKKKIKNNKSNKFNEYKDYVKTSENIDYVDTESQLKSSKRETAKKKFFSPNPPKKNDIIVNSLVFSKKDQKKIAKSNSAFFENNKFDIEDKKNPIVPKIYEKEYNPQFKGPKIISENLGFYNKENAEEFEQEKDSDNENPPYFGKLKRKKKKDNKNIEAKNAEMRRGFYFKNRQIDLLDTEEELPQLSGNLTFEKKMEEFYNYSISFKKFLFKNIKSRYILITTFDRMSIVYERYMRAGNFAAQLAMFAFFLSLFFVEDENQIAYETKEKKQIGNLILYCFLADILSCFVVHLPAYCFWVNDKKIRGLYITLINDGGMNVLKQMENTVKKGRFFWNLLGIIIQLLFIFIGFYFSFGFCATYSYQNSSFCLGLIITCGLDFIVTEFLWEILIGLLFYIRDCGRIVVFLGTFFNTLRNIKHLV